MERIGVFIDGSNLYASAKALQFDIDYSRLLKWLAERGRIIRANYYTALVEDGEFVAIRPLVDWLAYNGFNTITKTAKEFSMPDGSRKIKGNMDIELAVDMMELSRHLDHVVLFSGDGDFRRLVESVQRRGIRVTVVSTVNTTPAMAADELRRQADEFVDLKTIADQIRRLETQGQQASIRKMRGAA